MKTTFASWLLLILAVGGLLQAQPVPPQTSSDNPGGRLQAPPAPPQTPPDYKSQIFWMRSNVLELDLSGDKRIPVANRDDLITPFQMKSYRNGVSNEVQLIGRAPECHVDQTGHRAWDAGPIVLFTPTTNVWVQGEGFLFVETSHSLDISNKVETRVLRSLLKNSMLSTAKTNEPETAGQILKIYSDRCHFDYQSNFAQYFGHVHAIDVQLDLTSEKLTIQMTSNSVIQTMLAEDNVILTTTNKGWAAGPRAYYYVTNGSEMTEMTSNPVWHNGDEQAWADKFLYDSTLHFLTAIGHVHVWWPNAPARPGIPPQADTNGYRKMWADFATLQWPKTNGPIEAMHAEGYVLIINQADQSSSTSDRADYVRTNDVFELTGHPVWWNDDMKVHGRTLTAEATNKMYHARGDALLERKVGGTTRTNQVLHIASETIDFQTNLAVFTEHVKTRLMEADVLRDSVDSDKLDVELFSNQVKTAVARGHVEGETAPDKLGRIKTIASDTLTVHNNPDTKMLTDILAENHVVLRQFGTNATDPRSRLTAVTATAYFSTVMTNKVDHAVAERDVVVDQVSTNQTIHATGERVDYKVAADEAKLTGAPMARDERHIVSNADYLIWQPKTNRFRAYGPYQIISVKPLTNTLSSTP